MPKIKLETIGQVLVSGFGDKVLVGVLIGALDGVTPERCYEYIKNNMQLLHWASDDDWGKYKGLARKVNIGRIAKEITRERVITDLRKHRPDLVSVIINHPEGLNWLQGQIDMMKQKLGAD